MKSLFLLALFISVPTWAAENALVVLNPGRHEIPAVSLSDDTERAVISLDRVAWPAASSVRVEIYLLPAITWGTNPICTLTSKGGASLTKHKTGRPQTIIDCPVPQGAVRQLRYSVIVTGLPITTLPGAAVKGAAK